MLHVILRHCAQHVQGWMDVEVFPVVAAIRAGEPVVGIGDEVWESLDDAPAGTTHLRIRPHGTQEGEAR